MSTLGKCQYRNLENGYKCGCLRYAHQSDNNECCKACGHYQNYHEVESLQNHNHVFLHQMLNNPLMHVHNQVQDFESIDVHLEYQSNSVSSQFMQPNFIIEPHGNIQKSIEPHSNVIQNQFIQQNLDLESLNSHINTSSLILQNNVVSSTTNNNKSKPFELICLVENLKIPKK